jgi:hypothetical protein
MHIHKPKAPHGLGEFAREIGVIVCGVLIAIVLDQTVEALRHRGEAKEMIRKLHDESIENRKVIAFDIGVCSQRFAQTDKGIALVGEALRAGRLPAAPDALPPASAFQPADAAWITIRDSALLPIMPKLTVDNYWKLDVTGQAVLEHNRTASESRQQLNALLQVAHQRPMDQALANELLLSLNQFRQAEQSYCTSLGDFRDENEIVLSGKELNIEEAMRESKRLD